MAEERRAIHAYLTVESHEVWHTVSEEAGVSLSGFLEALATDMKENPPDAGGHPRWSDIIKSARKIDIKTAQDVLWNLPKGVEAVGVFMNQPLEDVRRILDATGAPVRNLAAATISVSTLSCGSAVGSAEIEQTAAVGSPLQNLGNGYYQLNWGTPKTYASSCKTMQLNLGEVSYVDSAGLGDIVGAYTTITKEGGTLKLANVTKKLQDLLIYLEYRLT